MLLPTALIIIIFSFIMIKGLFNRAISQSGSAFCHWAYTENAVQKTKELAENLGCPTYYSKDTIKCLRSRPALAITKSLSNFLVNISFLRHISPYQWRILLIFQWPLYALYVSKTLLTVRKTIIIFLFDNKCVDLTSIFWIEFYII